MAATARLHGLDALRGIAALCVVGLHAGAVFGGFPGWFSKGYLAVDFFLMLSGFMMARGTEAKLARGLTPLAFMKARYRRFWPMMALGSAIGTPYLWIRAGNLSAFLPPFLANMALMPWPFRRLIFALNIPAWTIFFELVANAVHVWVLRRLGNRAIATLTLVALALTGWVGLTFGALDVGARPDSFLAGFPRIFLAYLIGVLTFRLRGDSPLLPAPGWLALAAMPAAILASWYWAWRDLSFDLAFVLLVCPLTIAGGLRIVRQTWLGWLSAEISFPLFAVHLPVLEGMRELGFGVIPAVCAAFAVTGAIVGWTNRPARRKAQPTS